MFQLSSALLITSSPTKNSRKHEYLDNVTICGKDRKGHDQNLKLFVDKDKKYGSTIDQENINLLGYKIENKTTSPDPDRLKSLPKRQEKSSPTLQGKRPSKSYWNESSFIPRNRFWIWISRNISKSIVNANDDMELFVVEMDAPYYSSSAVLWQCGQPVAFFFQKLNDTKRKYSAVEKKSFAWVRWKNREIFRWVDIFR